MQPFQEAGLSRSEGFDCFVIIASGGGRRIGNDASKAEAGARKVRHQF
jgi:hypothetical protein